MEQICDDEEAELIDTYVPAPTPTPAGMADAHSELQLYLGPDMNSSEAVRGTGDYSPSAKRLRVDYLVSRPLLGDYGVQAEDYLSY